MLRFFIAGDVVPKGIDPEEFVLKGEHIFAEFKSLISAADFSIVNFEAPVIKDKPTPIKKSGPCLGVASTTVDVLKAVGFNVFTLANNHFFDQGQTGVNATINECVFKGIKTVGGGVNITEARKPLLIDKDGRRVVIINACEHEFSITNTNHGGSNALDLISMQEDITSVRNNADFVILILHGGIEQYHYPTPRMKRWYRHFIDIGADVVINHHQHCVNGYEVYRGKPIFYGLGNFYFPWGSQPRPDSWNYGYAVDLYLDDNIGFNLVPFKQTVDAITLRDKSSFENEISTLNQIIQDDLLLQKVFSDYILSNENHIKVGLLPSFLRTRIFSAMAQRGFLGKLYSGLTLYALKNRLSCESHLELLQNLFCNLVEKENQGRIDGI